MFKYVAIALLGMGLIAGGTYQIYSMNAKERIAAAEAAVAESEAEQARLEAQKAKSEAQTESYKATQQQSAAKTAEEIRKGNEAEVEANRLKESIAKEERAKAEALKAKAADDRARAEAEAQKASQDRLAAADAKETARLEAQKAKSDAEAEASRAQTAADALAREKLVSEKIIAERDLIELRRLDLASVERDLMEWKRDLEEREQALKPEKTILDLSYAANAVAAEGTDPETAKLPENDMTLPSGTRSFSKVRRISHEKMQELSSSVESNVTGRLEKLYVDALKEDRIVDADYYRKQLRNMYPGWSFDPAGKSEKKENEEK